MNKCPNCGKTLDVGETVCSNCGVNILEQNDEEANFEEKNEDIRPKRFISKRHYGPDLFKHDDDFLLLNEYIGNNIPRMKSGISWCTLFFGPFYMFYRKMWVLGIISVIVYTVALLVIPNQTIGAIVILLYALVLAIKFKDTYINKALSDIEQIKAANPDKSDEDLIPDVAYKGGVSQISLLVTFIILIIVVVVNGAVIMTKLKSSGGTLVDLIKERLNLSKESLNKIENIIRENTETQTVGNLYIVFPKGYSATTEVNETFAEFNNKTECKITTTYEAANTYGSDLYNYLDIKLKSGESPVELEYKPIKLKDYNWLMVKSPDTTPKYVTYVALYNDNIYNVTFETERDDPTLCFLSSEVTSTSFRFK